MQRAKANGIDAFALNIGVDPYTDTQLNFAYESAANNDMKVFISFDFNWWSINQPTAIGQEIAQYASRPAQLMVDNKVFVSSFAGDGVDVAQMQAAAGRDIYFVPNFHPGVGDFSTIQGALSWMAWPSNGRNRAPTAANNVSVAEADQRYLDALNGKPYMARKYVNFVSGCMLTRCSRGAMVLHPFRRRGLLQQELGVPVRPSLVQPLERASAARPALHRARHLERLRRVALYGAALVAAHRRRRLQVGDGHVSPPSLFP